MFGDAKLQRKWFTSFGPAEPLRTKFHQHKYSAGRPTASVVRPTDGVEHSQAVQQVPSTAASLVQFDLPNEVQILEES